MYRELAVSQAETQLAMNQISAAGNMLSTYVSVMSALAVAGQALMDRDAARLANWTATSTGAIGDEAPEGSILHLDFIQVLQGERFGTTSRVEFFATAILDDGNGTVFRSDRSYELFTYNPDDPPEDLPSDAAFPRTETRDLHERPSTSNPPPNPSVKKRRGQIDGRHPALAKLTLDAVAAFEGRVQAGDGVGHGIQDALTSLTPLATRSPPRSPLLGPI